MLLLMCIVFCYHTPIRFLFFYRVGEGMVLKEYFVQSIGKRFQRFHSLTGFQLTFPYCYTVPTHFCQFALFFFVALLVSADFLLPKLRVCLWCAVTFASLMSMPKTSIYKYAGSIFTQYKVRMPRKTRIVQTVSESTTPQVFSHYQLRLRVFRADRGHCLVPLFFRHFVHFGCEINK